MEWFRQRYIYLILRSKGEVLVIRNLFRKTCAVYFIFLSKYDSWCPFSILIARTQWPPDNPGLPPTIQLEHLLAAVCLSYRHSAVGDMELWTWDKVDMEALCASLIDQVWIMYCFSRDLSMIQKVGLGIHSRLPSSLSVMSRLTEGPDPWFPINIISRSPKWRIRVIKYNLSYNHKPNDEIHYSYDATNANQGYWYRVGEQHGTGQDGTGQRRTARNRTRRNRIDGTG
jgi:hypothetical protein